MSGSGAIIDYSLRAAKALERHLLCDLIRVVERQNGGSEYGYIGLGSFHFQDFILFYRLFGFVKMYSAEVVNSQLPRCKFNKPFPNIELHDGDAASMFGVVEDKRPYVCWLDFDGKLGPGEWDAIQSACHTLQPGSLLAVTLNSNYPNLLSSCANTDCPHEAKGEDEEDEFFLEIKRKFDLEDSDFVGSKSLDCLDRIVDDMCSEWARENPHSKDDDELVAECVGRITYQDGQRMYTLVYYIDYDEGCLGVRRKIRKSRLDKFFAGNRFKIDIPVMTGWERRSFERRLDGLGEALTAAGIRKRDAREFESIWRYWPYHSEVQS